MKITVLSFGQVAAITGNQFISTEPVADTDALKSLLCQQFPQLSNMKFAVAVDKKLVHENTPLTDNSIVALLPPFSGG